MHFVIFNHCTCHFKWTEINQGWVLGSFCCCFFHLRRRSVLMKGFHLTAPYFFWDAVSPESTQLHFRIHIRNPYTLACMNTSLLTLPVFLSDRCTPTHTHMHTVPRTSSAELNLPQLPYRSTGTRISFSLILDATFKCASVFFCLFDICFSCFLFGFLQSHKLSSLNGGTKEWENWGTVMEANEWKCGGDVWFKSRWSLHACMWNVNTVPIWCCNEGCVG